jgi:hypothetical protein
MTKAASAHRYRCGQLVTLTDLRDLRANWSGGFRIIDRLAHGGVPRYRLVSSGDAITRTADERQLTTSFAIER